MSSAARRTRTQTWRRHGSPEGDQVEQADTDAVALRGVDLSGGATTIGSTSVAKARSQALAGGPPGSRDLLALYRQWQADQAVKASPRLQKVERAALKKSAKRTAEKLRDGADNHDALAAGFKRYRKQGGSRSYSAWLRTMGGR